MTIFLMLQGVVALVVLNVMVSRYAHRRNREYQENLVSDEFAVRQLDYKIQEAQRQEQINQQKIDGCNEAIAEAEKQAAAAEKELDELRKAPPDIYFIFDRLEPKPGIIWEVYVGRNPDVPMGARLAAVWKQPRRYLVAAKSQREAQERAAQRFFEKTGLAVAHVSPCALFMTKRAEAGEAAGDMDAAGRGRAMERARA